MPPTRKPLAPSYASIGNGTNERPFFAGAYSAFRLVVQVNASATAVAIVESFIFRVNVKVGKKL